MEAIIIFMSWGNDVPGRQVRNYKTTSNLTRVHRVVKAEETPKINGLGSYGVAVLMTTSAQPLVLAMSTHLGRLQEKKFLGQGIVLVLLIWSRNAKEIWTFAMGVADTSHVPVASCQKESVQQQSLKTSCHFFSSCRMTTSDEIM